MNRLHENRKLTKILFVNCNPTVFLKTYQWKAWLIFLLITAHICLALFLTFNFCLFKKKSFYHSTTFVAVFVLEVCTDAYIKHYNAWTALQKILNPVVPYKINLHKDPVEEQTNDSESVAVETDKTTELPPEGA